MSTDEIYDTAYTFDWKNPSTSTIGWINYNIFKELVEYKMEKVDMEEKEKN